MRFRLVGGFTNVIFRVDTADGRYALRIDLHQDHTDDGVDVEPAWLKALAPSVSSTTSRTSTMTHLSTTTLRSPGSSGSSLPGRDDAALRRSVRHRPPGNA
jgi:hypothetical protein